MTPAEQYVALERGELVRATRRDVIVASGPDTERFLQGQLSQDVAAMVVGTTRWTLHLQPNGRLIGIARITRRSADEFLLDSEGGVGEHIHAGLSRFLIRTKCTLTLTADVDTAQWVTSIAPVPSGDDTVVLPAIISTEPLIHGYDILGANLFDSSTRPLPASVSAEVSEAFRIATGQLSAALDLSESTIPSETGFLDAAVTFGKGCYVGQELVERIDSRGRIVRLLRRLETLAPVVDPAAVNDLIGAELLDDVTLEVVGHLTSVAIHPVSGNAIAIGLVRARVDIAATVSASTDDKRTTFTVKS